MIVFVQQQLVRNGMKSKGESRRDDSFLSMGGHHKIYNGVQHGENNDAPLDINERRQDYKMMQIQW